MIVIEGIEGAGKSSAMSAVKKTLKSLQVADIISTREPGGTPIAEILRDILKYGCDEEVLTNQAELLLMYASRVQLLNTVIKPALNKGTWVVSDRYDLSSFAYQGAGRQMDRGVIQMLSDFCLEGFSPSLIIYLDISPELSFERVKGRGARDRIEQETLSFFTRVREGYLDYASQNDSVRVIDASKPLVDVTTAIEHAIITWHQEVIGE